MLQRRWCEALALSPSPLPLLVSFRSSAPESCAPRNFGALRGNVCVNSRLLVQFKTSATVHKEVSTLHWRFRPAIMSAVASQALKDKVRTLCNEICTNPKLLSPEAAEFMLSVSSSHNILSAQESEEASVADLIFKGVDPKSSEPVLLVCTTTMFPDPVESKDVEKAQRRAQIWQKAVGPSFSVVSVVAGFELQPEVAQFAEAQKVVCCNLNL